MRLNLRTLLLALSSLLLAGWAEPVCAQFREMESLPWVPKRPDGSSATAAESQNALEQLTAAVQNGDYRQAVERYYPMALAQGYQRNAGLYNQTRRALRQLLQSADGAAYWERMQRLYSDRYTNVGRDEYHYRNTLETAAWCDEQLHNEELLWRSSAHQPMEACFDRAHQLLSQAQGKADPVVVLQAMFVPLNREHAAHPERGKAYAQRYSDVVRWLEVTEQYMQNEHPDDYQTYYKPQTLALVREESERQMTADASVAEFEARRAELQQQLRAHADSLNLDTRVQMLYADALDSYRHHQWAEAYQKVNEALAVEPDMREARLLKSNILQNAANASSAMADKVAFWCAAYEAGQGYAERRTQRHILAALKNHLFMTGKAGQVHSTRSPFSIRQRIWTVEELRNK